MEVPERIICLLKTYSRFSAIKYCESFMIRIANAYDFLTKTFSFFIKIPNS